MKTLAKTEAGAPMSLEEAVWLDPARMSGVPCFRGTRLPVQQLFDWLEGGIPLGRVRPRLQDRPQGGGGRPARGRKRGRRRRRSESRLCQGLLTPALEGSS